jgi:hypothetical protein
MQRKRFYRFAAVREKGSVPDSLCLTMVCVGLPHSPAQIPAANLIFQGKCLAGSLIGGIADIYYRY